MRLAPQIVIGKSPPTKPRPNRNQPLRNGPLQRPQIKNKKPKMEKMSEVVFEDSDLDSAKDWIGGVNAWDPRARH